MVGVGCLLFFVLVFWSWILGLVFVVLEFPPLFLGGSGFVWVGLVGVYLAMLIVVVSVPTLQVELGTRAGVHFLWVFLQPLVLR